MKRDRRVRLDKDFQQAFKKGKSFGNRQFVIYYFEGKNQSKFRIGISVSKKIGNAVVRNRVKRYVRQSFLELMGKVREDCDYIIIAREPSSELSVTEVKSSLIHILKKIKKL